MVLNGRAGMINDRDEDILTDLFLAGCLTTSQIQRMYFSAHSTAKGRMYKLHKKGYVNFEIFDVGENLWFLTKEAFLREARNAESEETQPFSPPKERTAHYTKINDLYVKAAPMLDSIVGEWPEWHWLNEYRARRGYERAGRDRAYRPDAELHFRDHTFVIERQTAEARASRGILLSRMADYADYVEHITGRRETTQVLWACDTERDMNYAREGGEKYGLFTVAGDVEKIADHIEGTALRLK